MYVLFTYRWAYNQGQGGSFISEKQKNLTLISVTAWNTAVSHRSRPVGRRKLTMAEIDDREAAVFVGYVSHLFWNRRRSIPSLDYPQHCVKCSQPTFRHHWFLRKMAPEKRAQKFHFDDASLPRSGQCFWLIVLRGEFTSANQKHYLDVGSDTSSVWNFRARFSDVISRGNSWQHREMSAVF